mmetsp:Transcript_8206/g.12601  ORF Transcript_8206/g.12601 Transcript_8206/m.12601 type:complete len:698 (-) Transcript_8206:82-2175(-)|eukprot:CAMPEP_0178931084 /NCGR_PEP_ID=MMETSP0786-20121207/21691_1 /TAXON_ID=186022 /ORGANISM="Thalassionema frauenfeldii, Strain CCMP 1798" /LENGTH=697 /DNA_ID=CAMNT_0020607877 /DNA_START=414 /DNA_END=2507 /DNA_ORIENTATION=-
MSSTKEVRAWGKASKITKDAYQFDRYETPTRYPEKQYFDPSAIKPAGPAWEEADAMHDKLDVDDIMEEEYDEETKLQRDIFGVFFRKKRREDLGFKEKESSLVSLWDKVNGTMPWVQVALEDNDAIHARLLAYLDWGFRGLGQIFFCNNPLSGLLILIALFVSSTRIAVHCVIAIFSATLSARVLGFDTSLIASGLFGYNAALLGIGLATFHSAELHTGYSVELPFLTIFISILSGLFFVGMSKILLAYDVPPMTLPFDVLLSTAVLGSTSMANIDFGEIIIPSLPVYGDQENFPDYGLTFGSFLLIVLKGIGQIVFTENIASIILLLIALAICSRRIVLTALAGSALGTGVAIFVGLNPDEVNAGLYSYCPALTCLATGIFFVPSLSTYILAAFGATFTVILQSAISSLLIILGLPVSSFPFSFIIITLVLLQGNTKYMVAVPLESITIPEDHLRRATLIRGGFKLFLQALGRNVDTDRRARKIMAKLRASFDLGKVDLSVGKEDVVGQSALNMFRKMSEMNGAESSRTINSAQFGGLLDSIGMSQEPGKSNALHALSLMDLDKTDSISQEEWLVFCRNCVELHKVRDILSRCFQFVDTSGDGHIQIDELNEALDYLDEPTLSEEERKTLGRISRYPNEFDNQEMITYVVLDTLKRLVQHYHESMSVYAPPKQATTQYSTIELPSKDDAPPEETTL